MPDDHINPIADLDQALRNVVQYLQENPKAYRSFGCFWWIVKDMLKRHGYTTEHLYFLGNYTDPEVMSHLPQGPDEYLLAVALDEHGHNIRLNLGSADVYYPDNGEPYHLEDSDAGF